MKAQFKRILDATLYSYQQRWLNDTARYKIGLWARQTGKDFSCAAEAVLDCIDTPQNQWLIIACGERQALESLEKVKSWAERLADKAKDSSATFNIKSTEVRFGNGSRIRALPAKPAVLRGYSANLILTEFAFHDDPDGVWRAVFPIITNPLQGGEKKLRIISTPNGQANLFHQLWTGPDYSKHKVTIHEAVAAGLQIDIPMLQRNLNDAEAWAQEYECQFIDQSAVLLPYELIESCESPDAFESATPEILSSLAGDLFAGVDFGRKHDRTVCWTVERVNGILWTREVLVLEKMSTPDQVELLRPRVAQARRACLDYTGPGIGLGDLLARDFGGSTAEASAKNDPAAYSRVELCTFTSGLKSELFPRMRAEFERGLIRIPSSNAIREDLHSVHRIISQNGQISYRASSSADGHSDRCTALALALHGARSFPESSKAASVGRKHQGSSARKQRIW
jgi:phage FluMu gp28-like protein